MPSPRSKYAPYFSGHRDTFKDFLAEFEDLAYRCRLTDQQRVDTLICYVNSSFREYCRTLSGYRSCDWSRFRHSLIDAFRPAVPRHEIDRQKLHDFIKDSSKNRMFCEEDVLQYHKAFIHYTNPLVHSQHLTESERDVEFWYGFHPRDRDLLWPRLLDLFPFQPRDVPFCSDNILYCARRAFAYDEPHRFSSRESQFRPWFKPRNVDHRHPADSQSYSQSSSDSGFPSPHSFEERQHFSDPHFSFSFSLPPSDFRHMPAPSAIADKPESEPEYTRSITPTSPHAPLFSASCADLVPEFEHALSPFPSTTSCIDIVPELEHVSKSSFPPPGLSLPLVSLPTPPSPDNTPDLSSIALTATPSHSSSIPSNFNSTCSPFLARLTTNDTNDEPDSKTKTETEIETDNEIEKEKEKKHSSPSSLVAPPPPPLSSIPPELENQEQPEHESASQAVPVESPLVARRQSLMFEDPDLKFFPTNAAPLSPSESSELCEPFPMPLYVSNAPDPPQSTSQDRMLGVTIFDPVSVPLEDPASLPSIPQQSSPEVIQPEVVPTPSPSLANAQPAPLTFPSSRCPDRSITPPSSPSPSDLSDFPLESCKNCPILPVPSLATSNSFISAHSPPSSPAQRLLEPTQVNSVSVPLKATLVPAPPATPSIPPKQTFEVTQADSVSPEVPNTATSPSIQLQQASLREIPTKSGSAPLNDTPAPTSSTHTLEASQESAPVYEAPSTLAFHLHSPSPPLLLPDLSSTHFDFTFSLVTTAALVLALVNISKIHPTHAHKLWSKNEDFGISQKGTPSPGNNVTHRLVQQTVRPARLVFDPGGFVFALASLEDIRLRLLKTCSLPLRIVAMCNLAVITQLLSTISFFSPLKPRIFFV